MERNTAKSSEPVGWNYHTDQCSWMLISLEVGCWSGPGRGSQDSSENSFCVSDPVSLWHISAAERDGERALVIYSGFWSCQGALQSYYIGVRELEYCVGSHGELQAELKYSWDRMPTYTIASRWTSLMPFQLKWSELCTHSRFPFILVLWYITGPALCLHAVGFCCIFSLWMIMDEKSDILH